MVLIAFGFVCLIRKAFSTAKRKKRPLAFIASCMKVVEGTASSLCNCCTYSLVIRIEASWKDPLQLYHRYLECVDVFAILIGIRLKKLVRYVLLHEINATLFTVNC